MKMLIRHFRNLLGWTRKEEFPRQSSEEDYRRVYIQCLKAQRSDRRVLIVFFLAVTLVVIGLAVLLSTRGDPHVVRFPSLKELLSW